MIKDLSELSEQTGRQLKEKPFHPHPALWNGHLQTIVGSQQRRSFGWGWKTCLRETVTLNNGAVVRADAVFTEQAAPTLVAVHGMGGSSESMYMLGLSHKAFLKGWNSVRLSLYNLNRNLEPPKVFDAGCSADLDEIVRQLLGKFGLGRCLLVGVSMGGNILLKLLGEWESDYPSQVVAAATISPLVNLSESWRILESRSNRLYRWYYVRRLRRLALSRAELLEAHIDLVRLEKVRTIRDFDEALTVPLGGYQDVAEYYDKASAASGLRRIRVPTLIIHSKDDPLLPWQPLAGESVRHNQHLIVVLTDCGGHAAFIEAKGADIDRSWAENRVIDFFSLAV